MTGEQSGNERSPRLRRQSSLLGVNVGRDDPLDGMPAEGRRPPSVWGTLGVEGDQVVARLKGWRAIWAVKRSVSIPVSTVVSASHDAEVRAHVSAKLRRRKSPSGVIRIGAYHSLEGWSFWSIGLGRNAVVVEASGARYRFVVVEVEDPAATVAEIRAACALEPVRPIAGARDRAEGRKEAER